MLPLEQHSLSRANTTAALAADGELQMRGHQFHHLGEPLRLRSTGRLEGLRRERAWGALQVDALFSSRPTTDHAGYREEVV